MGCLESRGRIAHQHAGDAIVKLKRQVGKKRAGSGGFFQRAGHQFFHDRLTAIRNLPGQQPKQRTTQAEDVAAMVGRLGVARLFRSDVVGGPHDLPSLRQLGIALDCGAETGQAEIEDLDDRHEGGVGARGPVVVRRAKSDEQVGRLDVAMHHPPLVGVRQSQRSLANVFAGFAGRQRAALARQRFEVLPLDVLHHQEVFSLHAVGVERGDDVGMLQGRDRLDFAMKSGGGLFVAQQCVGQHLQGDDPREPGLPGLVDGSHAPGAHPIEQFVFAQEEEVPTGNQHVRLPARNQILFDQPPGQRRRILEVFAGGLSIDACQIVG